MSDPYLGEIKLVAFNFTPRGFAPCVGQVLSIAQNSALFALLGTTFGGDGVNTFGLPDYRARAPIGIGAGGAFPQVMQGQMSGTQSVSILTTNMPSHVHGVTASVATPVAPTATNGVGVPTATTILGQSMAGGRAASLYTTDAATTTLLPFNATVTEQSVGGNQPVGILNPYLGTNFVIALQGIFPSRD